jgi:hypothetical protein
VRRYERPQLREQMRIRQMPAIPGEQDVHVTLRSHDRMNGIGRRGGRKQPFGQNRSREFACR